MTNPKSRYAGLSDASPADVGGYNQDFMPLQPIKVDGSTCYAEVIFAFPEYNVPVGNATNLDVLWETSPSALGPWLPLGAYGPECFDTICLFDNANGGLVLEPAVKVDEVLTPGALTGTLSDGTGYTISNPDADVVVGADNAVAIGNVTNNVNTVTVTFDAPVCLEMAGGPGLNGSQIWATTGGQGFATTDGSPWVFVPGTADPGITVSGGTATGVPSPGVISDQPWGSLFSDGVTTFTYAAWVNEAFHLNVSTRSPEAACAASVAEPVECLSGHLGFIRPSVRYRSEGDDPAIEDVQMLLRMDTVFECVPNPKVAGAI